MLIFDLKVIGNKLFEIRNQKLLTGLEVAERAECSERNYADIERGNANMRFETFFKYLQFFKNHSKRFVI